MANQNALTFEYMDGVKESQKLAFEIPHSAPVRKYLQQKNSEVFEIMLGNRREDMFYSMHAFYDEETLQLNKLELFISGGGDVVAGQLTFDAQGNFIDALLKTPALKLFKRYNANEIQQMRQFVEMFADKNVQQIIQMFPDFFEKLYDKNEQFKYTGAYSYEMHLFAACLRNNVQLQDESYKKFMKQYASNSSGIATGANDANDAAQQMNLILQSPLFKQLLQKAQESDEHYAMFGDVEGAEGRCIVYLYDARYNQMYALISSDGDLLNVYEPIEKIKTTALPTKQYFFGKAAFDDGPQFLMKAKNRGTARSPWKDADAFVENFVEEALAAKRARKQMKQQLSDSPLYKNYAAFKKLTDLQQREAFMQQHGVVHPIRVGRKTIINNDPVFTGSYTQASPLLSTATLKNLDEASRRYNLEWNKVYIQPVSGRLAMSFFIEGKKQNGDKVYYCRKEYNSAGAGQSFIIDAATGKKLTR